MNYTVSDNGKYFYKVSNDGKKTRISKEEYSKPSKPSKSKKGGSPEIGYVIVIGSGGNLSPVIQKHLQEKGLTLHTKRTDPEFNAIENKYIVFGSVDYDLTKETQQKKEGSIMVSATPGGIKELCDKIKEIVEKNQGITGAIIFSSAERDPAIFGHCKNENTYNTYLNKAVGDMPSLVDKRKELMNLNTLAPTEVFDKIKEFSNVFFVYISSIYVFQGLPTIRDRKEAIEGNGLDFVENIKESINKHAILFSDKDVNLYALGKRYVEIYLNDKIVKEGAKAKVVILRMDGITPEPDKSRSLKYTDGTFLLALSNPIASYNVLEKRYPVFPSQISKVIIGAVMTQTEQLKVYHVAGTEKEKGTTKGDIIREVLKDSIITKDRHMADAHAMFADQNYADINGTFFDKLKAIFDGIPKAGGRKKR